MLYIKILQDNYGVYRESKRPRVKPSMPDTVIQRIGRELDERVKGARQGANNRKMVRAILVMINVIKLILMSMV